MKVDLSGIEGIKEYREILWLNDRKKINSLNQKPSLSIADVLDAEERLKRFSPYLMEAFPELIRTTGIIESELKEIPSMKEETGKYYGFSFPGRLFLKCDYALPVSGSIKARGGIYEVLKYAEDIALKNGFSTDDDYRVLGSEKYRELFSDYSLSVGSTGNLGLSIGLMGSKLGFKTHVHMSSDARKWKKDLLRSRGVTVTEYDSDYSKAVKEGRKLSEKDPMSHFVDDENSKTLFLGYAVAALRFKKQAEEMGIADDDTEFIFYLPCGVGGGPGGIAWGMDLIYGDRAKSFFAEPTHSPAMLLGLKTGLDDGISVGDIGLDNKTEADGLAVGRPSPFIGSMVGDFIEGCYTVSDENMLRCGALLEKSESIRMEPSAQAGFSGPLRLSVKGFFDNPDLKNKNIIHVVWGTGGSMVPEEEMEKYMEKGRDLL